MPRTAAARIGCWLLAAAVLAGCGAQPPAPSRPAAATVAPEGPRVPQLGPFRHTARQAFRWRIAPVTAARLGASHAPGCPLPVSELRLLTLTHLGLDGRPRTGELVVRASVAVAVVEVFRTLYDAGFPVARMETVDRYGGDDDASMAADNTSGYNCRRVTGGTGWSEHAYGTAIDVNPVENPYVRGSFVAPDAGRQFLDRSDVRPGMAVTGGVLVRAFAAAGWAWGGQWSSLKDYQHFSLSGR